jgi:hypothetical protein
MKVYEPPQVASTTSNDFGVVAGMAGIADRLDRPRLRCDRS